MSAPLKILVYENQTLVCSKILAGSVELGRQATPQEVPYAPAPQGPGRWRLVIAHREDQSVSREHALVERLNEGRARVINRSKKQKIRWLEGGELAEGAACERPLPLLMALGGMTVRVQEVGTEDDGSLHSLADAPRRPGEPSRAADASLSLAALTGTVGNALALETFLRDLQGVLAVLQSAVNSSDFFDRAARAVIELVGLDSGRVLLRAGGEFREEAVAVAPQLKRAEDWRPSRRVLEQVLRHKRTFWQVPGAEGSEESLLGVRAVVAAPILDRAGEVIGLLYGDRKQRPGLPAEGPISQVEALLVELLAVGVAFGLVRLAEEKEKLRARVQFEQFFTRELADRLAAEPDLLQGRDRDVTLLFGDIRGFSSFSSLLGPARTVEWVSEVMEELSECVRAEQGVLVDYIGDELIAMWGAPTDQPDHAGRACRAARAMLARLPALNARWQAELGRPMRLGVGLNTGVARVGNIGTRSKFKYGPLGEAVNLASRVQGATKYLQAPLLITRTTYDRMGPGFLSRRLCRVRLVNIADPVELFELLPSGPPARAAVREDYERALAEFERKNFRAAARLLAPLVAEEVNDGPSLVLMSRAVQALVEEPARFDPVWELPGK